MTQFSTALKIVNIAGSFLFDFEGFFFGFWFVFTENINLALAYFY